MKSNGWHWVESQRLWEFWFNGKLLESQTERYVLAIAKKKG